MESEREATTIRSIISNLVLARISQKSVYMLVIIRKHTSFNVKLRRVELDELSVQLTTC